MKSFRKTVAGLFGHDRRERRGTYLLSVLLIVLLAFRFLAFRPPGRGEVSDEMLDAFAAAPGAADADMRVPELFAFDPNVASYEELLQLGLTERQAATLVSYRSSGAQFRRPEDIRKVYGIDSVAAARLIPFIVLAAEKLPVTEVAEGKPTPTGRGERYSGSGKPTPTGRGGTDAGTVNPPVKGRAAVTGNPPATGHADRDAGSGRPLSDLNSCSAGELEQLPGIGPVLSVRIIKYRALLGGFVSKEQLGEVYGLDSSVVRIVSERVTLTCGAVIPLLLDSASFRSLARHPYVGQETARLITAFRSLTTGPLTLGSLVAGKVISPEQAERLAPYVRPPEGVTGEDYEFILSKVLK